MRRFLAVVGVALALLAGSEARAQGWSEWLSDPLYQELVTEQVQAGQYPVEVEAAIVFNHVRYRARFAPLPQGLDFQARHGMSDREYALADAFHRSEGFRLLHHQRLAFEGNIANQAVWVRPNR